MLPEFTHTPAVIWSHWLLYGRAEATEGPRPRSHSQGGEWAAPSGASSTASAFWPCPSEAESPAHGCGPGGSGCYLGLARTCRVLAPAQGALGQHLPPSSDSLSSIQGQSPLAEVRTGVPHLLHFHTWNWLEARALIQKSSPRSSTSPTDSTWLIKPRVSVPTPAYWETDQSPKYQWLSATGDKTVRFGPHGRGCSPSRDLERHIPSSVRL